MMAEFYSNDVCLGLHPWLAASLEVHMMRLNNGNRYEAAKSSDSISSAGAEKEDETKTHESVASLTTSDCPTSLSFDKPVFESADSDEIIPPGLAIAMMSHFHNQKAICKGDMKHILELSIKLFSSLPSLIHVPLPNNREGEVTVCGDTHGQYYDLCNIFSRNGLPTSSNPYIFNGDFVDRGLYSVEVITSLLAWKLVDPACMHLIRGNHESKDMNESFGFKEEVLSKYDEDIFNLFTEVFNWLPIAAVIENKVLVVHGGLCSDNGGKIDLSTIAAIKRNMEPDNTKDKLMFDMLWSDPFEGIGTKASSRGGSVTKFGSDITEAFLLHNNLDLLVRSHEMKADGFETCHNGKCVTIFSAPSYCDHYNNKGAYIRFGSNLRMPKFIQFSAVPHPKLLSFVNIIKESKINLYSNDRTLVHKAAESLRKILSNERSPPIQMVIQAGLVSRLVDLLQQDQDPIIQHEAAWVLTNITAGSTQGTKAVVDSNACPHLIRLLENSKSEDVRQLCAWALKNISGDSLQCVDE